MKSNLLQLIMLLLFVFVNTSSYSQQKDIPSASERATKLTDWMKTNLQLTDDQVPKVQDINMKYANKMEELKNNAAGKRQKLLTLKENDKAKDAELKQVFTDSQYKTYMTKKEELKKQLKQELKERKAG
jgi:hypothetical protein